MTHLLQYIPRRPKALCACALAATALLSAAKAARAQQQPPEAKPSETYRDQIVAEVEHEPITFHELVLAARLTSEYRDLVDNQPGNVVALRQSLQRQLDLLIEEKILLLQCTKEKITLTKEDEKRIEREVDRLAEPHGGLDGLKSTLKKIGVTYDYFVERKRTNLLVGKLLLKNVSREIYVEPERIRKYYEEHKHEKFRREAITKFFQIDIYSNLAGARVPDELKNQEPTWNADAAKKYAEQIRDRARKSPAEWRSLAEATTMDASMVDKGGLVQLVGEHDLSQQGLIGEAAAQLKEGEVSPVIESRVGYHLVFMKERSKVGVLPFSEVQREIAEKLRQEIWQERLKAWIKKIKDEAYYRVYLPNE